MKFCMAATVRGPMQPFDQRKQCFRLRLRRRLRAGLNAMSRSSFARLL